MYSNASLSRKKPANKKSSPLSQKYERKRMEKVNTANRPPPKSGSQEEKIISVSPSQTRPRVPSL